MSQAPGTLQPACLGAGRNLRRPAPKMSIPPPGYEKRQASPQSSPPPAPQGAPLSHEDANAQNGSRPADDNRPYEFKSVQALRGRESSAKAKWQNQGWEFVSEDRGRLRTELNFRRVKPKTLSAHLMRSVAAFGRMEPKTQLFLACSCALLLVAGIVGIVGGIQSAGDTPDRSVTHAASGDDTPAGAAPAACPPRAPPPGPPPPPRLPPPRRLPRPPRLPRRRGLRLRRRPRKTASGRAS